MSDGQRAAVKRADGLATIPQTRDREAPCDGPKKCVSQFFPNISN
jgi:hypothetical protein